MNLNKYLVSYLIENSELPDDDEILKSVKTELDWRLYHYGDSFSKPWVGQRPRQNLRRRLAITKNTFLLSRNKPNSGISDEVISSVYFPNFNLAIQQLGCQISSPFWAPAGLKISGNVSLYRQSLFINNLIRFGTVADILKRQNRELIKLFMEDMLNYYRVGSPRAICLFTDQYFFSKIAIRTFKKIQRPSFILSHGLPGIYSKHVDHSADKLFVWGRKIKENYLKHGFEPDKVQVLGHPSYNKQKNSRDTPLRFEMSNILVLAKAISWHQNTYTPNVVDRGLIIVYLLSIKKVLKSLGVKKVRLRPHPSQNVDWILDFVGRDFFEADQSKNLEESLRASSVVIGPTSTVLTDALSNGVNYVVYEPQDEHCDLFGNDLVPPFDGEDEDIPVAKNEDGLKQILMDRVGCSRDALNGYIDDFDIDVLKSNLN